MGAMKRYWESLPENQPSAVLINDAIESVESAAQTAERIENLPEITFEDLTSISAKCRAAVTTLELVRKSVEFSEYAY
ncbi:MAG TPA: hypothetical protein VF644_10405 [Pyrinomonadaceae bacterium]|jgi:hypothetical protein